MGQAKVRTKKVQAQLQPCRDCGGLPTKYVAVSEIPKHIVADGHILAFFCDDCLRKSAFASGTLAQDLVMSDDDKARFHFRDFQAYVPEIRKTLWTAQSVLTEIHMLEEAGRQMLGDHVALEGVWILLSDLTPDHFSAVPFNCETREYRAEDVAERLRAGLVPIGYVIGTKQGSQTGVLPVYAMNEALKPALGALLWMANDISEQIWSATSLKN